MERLCIIPCSQTKIWDDGLTKGAIEARYVYTGNLTKWCREYAQSFFKHWVILSAKYGFLFPEDLVPSSYNETFKRKSEEVITIEALKEQVIKKELYQFSKLTVLAGKDYRTIVGKVFGNNYYYEFPLLGCRGNGEMMNKLKNAVLNCTEISSIVFDSRGRI